VRGAGTLVVDVLAVTALQRSLPPELLGRVFGAFFTAVLAAISLGALLTPVVIGEVGLNASLWLAGALLPALCLLGLPWLRRMDDANVTSLAALEPRIESLARLGIFAEASRPVLERLARTSVEEVVPPQTTLIHEGDEPDAFYVLLDGEMSVHARGTGTTALELPTMRSGAWFGEIGLLQSIPRTATVTATRSSRVLRISGEDFLSCLLDAPASAALLEGARSRLARTQPDRRHTADIVTQRDAGRPDDAAAGPRTPVETD